MINQSELNQFSGISDILNRKSVQKIIAHLESCDDFRDMQKNIVKSTGIDDGRVSIDLGQLSSLEIVECYRSKNDSRGNFARLNFHTLEKYANTVTYLINIKKPKV